MSAIVSNSAAPPAWKTIFVAEIDSSLSFSMVEYTNGQLDILRNGTSIAASPWSGGDLANCVRTFRTVSRLAAATNGPAQR